MTAWRQVIELSLERDDLAKLVSIARSRTESASRVERARMLLAYREDPSFFAVGISWGYTIRLSSAALNELWPMAQWLHSTIARGQARSRQSPGKPGRGWCRWPAAGRKI